MREIHIHNHGGRGFPHLFHFFMTVLTCGFWLPVWFLCWLFS